MGGGARTFPGGLNKWQWKRMHEKRASQKEKRLLDQEKQLYQARVRSEIRAQYSVPGTRPDPETGPTHGPVSSREHVKALADRFVKEGAEDLWNENDGPISSSSENVEREGFESGYLKREFDSTARDGRRFGGGQRRYYSLYSCSNGRNARNFRENSSISSEMSSNLSNLSNSRFYSSFTLTNSGNLANWSTMPKPRFFSAYSLSNQMNLRNLTYLPGARVFSGYLSCESRSFACLSHGGNVLANARDYCGYLENVSNWMQRRFYSVEARGIVGPSRFRFKRNESSSGDEVRGVVRPSRLRFKRNESSSEDDFSDEDDDARKGRKMMSSAALGKYDSIKTRRVPLQHVEDEDDLSQHVKVIRKEFYKRKEAESVEAASNEDSLLSEKRFDECNVSPLTVKALTDAGYVQMTRVQEATLSDCLEGQDALVKAKTGTGKSIAFLLPAIETVLKASINNSRQRVSPICALILCPTRELASQIAAEAKVLLKYHDGIGVQTLVGGTRFKDDLKRLESDLCHILVATPGRLLDHVENKSNFSVRVMGMKMLILDEADRLLDLGFRKDLEKIVDCLPRQRQSLLFSATLPKEVRRISQLVLKRDHAHIDTVGLGQVETHDKVKQYYLVAPHDQHFQIVHHLLKEHISLVPDYKVMVFCTTAMMTSLMFSVLHDMKMNVREIHSRKPQLYRTRVSEEFKEARRQILITSDVSSRGMDYPDVSLVIQVGIPTDREQYINRLGRTGRKGKGGEGILLLAPWEEFFLDEINDLPLQKSTLPHLDPDLIVKLKNSMTTVDTSLKEAAYHAWLGYYNSIREIGRDKTTLSDLAKAFSQSIGLQATPALFRKTALKMGLKDIPGIRVRK